MMFGSMRAVCELSVALARQLARNLMNPCLELELEDMETCEEAQEHKQWCRYHNTDPDAPVCDEALLPR